MIKLIRVVQGGKQVREIRLDAILGKFFDRLEKAHGTVEISDPDLETKLDESELKQLYAKFPELNPDRPLPHKPSTEPIAFREDVVVEEVSDVEELTNEEIVEWLVANEIEFDKRKKKNTDYLIQIITENEN
jgi:hypothetical protein